jgi:hypothetical protein
MVLEVLEDGTFIFEYSKGMELLEYFINVKKREIKNLTLHKNTISFKVGGIL